MDYDAFNGDADGICALIQLRLCDPRPDALLITGPKRDIELLGRIVARPGDRVTALDISLARNRSHALRLLNEGAYLFYADHHDPGERIAHAALEQHIVTRGEMCTSAIIDHYLGGACREWAAVGAFGDNMLSMGERLTDHDPEPLRELGTLINYNAYGESLSDLHYHPDALYLLLAPYNSPQAFLAEDAEVVPILREGFASDRHVAESGTVLLDTPMAFAVTLPNDPASRRYSGIHGNTLASRHPDRAHAVLTERNGRTYQISIRAPLATRRGAVGLAKQYGGGGREAAAGIDALPAEDLPRFLDSLRSAF